MLSGGLLLLELFTFRLATAAIGHGFATFAGITAPAIAAFGALVVARRSAIRGGHELDRTAAHLAGLSGTFAVFGVIGLTLISQKIGRARGQAEDWHIVVALASVWLGALFGGGAMGTIMRRGIRRVGRFGFAAAMGGAVACLSVPWMMDFGAPRAAIGNGLILGIAALMFARSGRAAHPRTAVLSTLPLAVMALIAGDVGAPWLKMRFDLGRRSRVAHISWSAQGLLAVQKVKNKRTNLAVDRHPIVPLAQALTPKRKPAFKATDLVYLTSRGEKGPVLVIGAAGGREVSVGMAYEHPRIDVIEQHAALVNELMLDEYAAITGYLFHQREVVKARIGDGRAGIDALPQDYQHVVVVGEGRFDQAVPRLLSAHDRLFTTQAIRSYLARLREDGTMLLRVPKPALPALIASAAEAMGGHPEDARERLLACADDSVAVLLVQQIPVASSRVHNLTKRCKRSRLTLEYPLKRSGRKVRDQARAEEERLAKLALLQGGAAITDDRPFLVSAPARASLSGVAWESLRALKSSAPPKKAKKGKKEPKEPPPAPTPGPVMTPVGVAAGSTALAFALLVLGLLVPPPRSEDRTEAGPIRAPIAPTLRWAFPFFGIAMAMCSFVLHDMVVRVVGDPAYAWSLVIPLGLVGVAAGRLWVDVMLAERLRSSMMIGLGLGLAWLVALWAGGGGIQRLADASTAVQLTACMFLLVVTGWQLGWPLAAGLRTVGAWDRAPATWCWGAHLGGWAVGGGLCATLVWYLGVDKLLGVGVAAYAIGAVALAVALRSEPPIAGTCGASNSDSFNAAGSGGYRRASIGSPTPRTPRPPRRA
jgi:hypothetical protein